jgi:addiction module HigA family antidote
MSSAFFCGARFLVIVEGQWRICFIWTEEGPADVEIVDYHTAVPTPNRVTTHPGEMLSEEFLKPLGMSVHALAMALRVPATRIGAIVKGERSVTADTALRLARFFGTSPEFWINLQAMHDLTKARLESGRRSSGMFGRGRGEARWTFSATFLLVMAAVGLTEIALQDL